MGMGEHSNKICQGIGVKCEECFSELADAHWQLPNKKAENLSLGY